MFVVLLRFSADKAAASEYMPGHQKWIRQGVEDGVFLLVGSIQPAQGGALIATGITREDLQARVAEDPFVVHDVVAAEVIEIAPNLTDPRLAFLKD